jgi:hypothetical protein
MIKAKKKKSGRRYGAKASQDVELAIHQMKRGALRSGGSGKKVTSRKQAVAIGLSEARREGTKVPTWKARSARKTARPHRGTKKP